MAKKSSNESDVKQAEKEVAKETTEIIEKLVVKESIAENKELVEAKVAKAGKRSSKAIKEAEEKIEKELRKEESDQTQEKITKKKPVSKSLVERKGKKYRDSISLIDKTKAYALAQATKIAVETSKTKFDSTVELHIRLGVDPRQADQNIRSTVILPNGTGKKIRVAVISSDLDKVKAATNAGAEIAGNEEIFQDLDKEKIEFDVLIATPEIMPKLGKYARLLGPKGLMPSPKSGTVTNEIEKAVNESKKGKVEYRVDSNGIVHLGIGKTSFGPDKLTDNAKSVFESIKSNKPATLKGSYILSIYLSTTMGPSIKINSSEI